MRNLGLMALAVAAGFAGVYALAAPPVVPCHIKGNVSMNSGERIYHMPGQHDYDSTVIDPRSGERWFCSEAEARTAGWRRATN